MRFPIFKKPDIHHRPRKFMSLYSTERLKSTTLEEIYRIFNRKDEADTRYLEKIGFTDIPCQSLTLWKYRTHREKATSISVIRLAFLKYHFRKNAPCCPSRIMIISLMSRSAGPSPVIWPIWITAEFLFILVSRFSSSAANTVSATRLPAPLPGEGRIPARQRNFWNVQLSFCLRTR